MLSRELEMHEVLPPVFHNLALFSSIPLTKHRKGHLARVDLEAVKQGLEGILGLGVQRKVGELLVPV